VPQQRKIAKKYQTLPTSQTLKLLTSPIHEHRLTALFILIHQFQKGDTNTQQQIYQAYLNHTQYINNWDLVDSSAHKIVGEYLLKNPQLKNTLYKLAKSNNLWQKRIAIIATFAFINHNQFQDSLKIAQILLHDPHDLIHKAVGWTLREIGKKNLKTETQFLDQHHQTMPRTMLRYAIEKFYPLTKQHYMKKVA
jgi:3-methyladenine DNA glycosylase AlkD